MTSGRTFLKPSDLATLEEERQGISCEAGQIISYNPNKHLSIQHQQQALPITAYKSDILYLVSKFQVVIIVGEAGSGKSTQIPQFLLEGGWSQSDKIIGVTQPRRVGVLTIAQRIAEELGCNVGEVVGYRIQFDSYVTHGRTRIKLLTDTSLLQELMRDPLLSNYSVIMLDDVHERSIFTEILLSLLRKIIKLRKDLRLIITSSTLEANKFKSFFELHKTDGKKENCVVYGIEGRVCNVEIFYTKIPVADYIKGTVELVLEIHRKQSPGDVLAFLTDEQEIRMVGDMINESDNARGRSNLSLSVHPLYASLPATEQIKVFKPALDRGSVRKVILSTNIAESSVTIPGVVYVIDCGFVKMNIYHPPSDTEFVATVPISRNSADQRAGRAGRIRSGKAFRLYTKQSYDSLPKQTQPEILRVNLAPVILSLKALGVDNIVRFPFLARPPAVNLARGLELLFGLGALDKDGSLLKPLGLRMAEMALHPTLSKILFSSCDLECSEEIVSIVALLLVRNVLLRPPNKTYDAARAHGKFENDGGDILTMLNAYLSFCDHGKRIEWCKEQYLNWKALNHACKIRETLVNVLEMFGVELKSARGDDTVVRQCIYSGLFPNLAKLVPGGAYQSVRCEGVKMSVHPSSCFAREMKRPSWIVFHEMSRSKQVIYVNKITPVEFDWIQEMTSHYYDYGTEREIEEIRCKKSRLGESSEIS